MQTDGLVGSIAAATYAVEIKTGNAVMSQAQAENNREHLPPGTPVLVLHE